MYVSSWEEVVEVRSKGEVAEAMSFPAVCAHFTFLV